MPQEESRSGFPYTVFGGLVTNSDPREIGAGAVRLENFSLEVPGQLTSRLGHTAVSFVNEEDPASANVMAMVRYETPAYKFVVYETTDGAIHAGRGASL